MQHRIDVLNLEWRSHEYRDRAIASPVCNYLRYLGFSVIEASVFNGYRLIDELKPKVLFQSNSIGAPINHQIVKYAASLGIKCYSSFSEGNFRENDISTFIWGHNNDSLFYEDALFVWSQSKADMMIKHSQNLREKIKISGGIGFDIYKLTPAPISKTEFLSSYEKDHYSKVIGVGCFDFGIFNKLDPRFERENANRPDKEYEIFLKDRSLFNETLNSVISNNPDILFLLKEHPGNQLGRWASAIEGLDVYQNVLIIKNEIPIYKCISVSDFWISYESTTVLEAWLLNKQTCLLNPLGGDFVRDSISLGSPIYCNAIDIQNAINKFYLGQTIPGFESKVNIRHNLIETTIQWDDGLNHVRAGNLIAEALYSFKNNYCNTFSISTELKLQIFREKLFYSISEFIRKHLKFLKIFPRVNRALDLRHFDEQEVIELSNNLLKSQLDYYKKRSLTKAQLMQIKCIQ